MSKSARTLPEGYEVVEENGRSIARKVAAQTPAAPSGPKAKKAAIRMPSSREPNKTELRFLQRLQRIWPDTFQIRYEAITFRLNSGCLYTADFTVWDGSRLRACYEVKSAFMGHSARSILAFKTAASEHPDLNFVLAQWKGGEWLLSKSDEPVENLIK